uniref:Uncharacterized protein n=1 Tax=Romanomermis culicivorax TaxID=13658 RepID=A0A915L0I7_ROMCU
MAAGFTEVRLLPILYPHLGELYDSWSPNVSRKWPANILINIYNRFAGGPQNSRRLDNLRTR